MCVCVIVCVHACGCVSLSSVFVQIKRREAALAVDSLGNCRRTCRGRSWSLATETQSGSRSHYRACWSHGGQAVLRGEGVLIEQQAHKRGRGGPAGHEIKHVREHMGTCILLRRRKI